MVMAYYDDPPIIQQLEDDLHTLRSDLRSAYSENDRLTILLAAAYDAADELRLARETDQSERVREFNELQRQITALRTDRDETEFERERVTEQRDKLLAEITALRQRDLEVN